MVGGQDDEAAACTQAPELLFIVLIGYSGPQDLVQPALEDGRGHTPPLRVDQYDVPARVEELDVALYCLIQRIAPVQLRLRQYRGEALPVQVQGCAGQAHVPESVLYRLEHLVVKAMAVGMGYDNECCFHTPL